MLAQQGHRASVRIPNGILHRWGVYLCQRLLLLDIVQNNRSRRAEQKRGGSSIEYIVRLDRRFHHFSDTVAEIPNLDCLLYLSERHRRPGRQDCPYLIGFIQHGKPIPRNKDNTAPRSLLPICARVLDFPICFSGQRCQFKQPTI